MMAGEGKPDPMTAQNFDPDDYKDKLIDQGYSNESAKMLTDKKKEQLEKASAPTAKFEIDLSEL